MKEAKQIYLMNKVFIVFVILIRIFLSRIQSKDLNSPRETFSKICCPLVLDSGSIRGFVKTGTLVMLRCVCDLREFQGVVENEVQRRGDRTGCAKANKGGPG